MLYTHMTDEALVVGARNILYKLSVDELRLKQTLTWNSVELDRDSCLVKGKVAPMRFLEIFFLAYETNGNPFHFEVRTSCFKPVNR